MKSPESACPAARADSPGPDSHNATTRTVAMPSDTNPSGDIFGGWVLSQMDLAGAIAASKRAQCRVVTVSIDRMSFLRPVQVGDILGVYTTITRTGRSSIDVLIDAWVRRKLIGAREKVTQATFTFVAVDDNGRPTALPDLDCLPDYTADRQAAQHAKNVASTRLPEPSVVQPTNAV